MRAGSKQRDKAVSRPADSDGQRTQRNRYNWLKIRTAYVQSNKSQRELCKEYGIPYSTLAQRCLREGWSAEREKYRSKVIALSDEQSIERESQALSQGRIAARFASAAILTHVANIVQKRDSDGKLIAHDAKELHALASTTLIARRALEEGTSAGKQQAESLEEMAMQTMQQAATADSTPAETMNALAKRLAKRVIERMQQQPSQVEGQA